MRYLRRIWAPILVVLAQLLAGCNIAPGAQLQLFGYGWVAHKALTPTYTVIDEGFLVVYGDTLTLDYDIQVENGEVEIAIMHVDYGLPSKLKLDVETLWSAEVASNDRQTVTVELPKKGHYKVEITLRRFMGEFTVKWRARKSNP